MARNALASFTTEAGDFQQLHWLTINLARQSSNHLEEIELLQRYDVLHPCAQAKQSLHQALLRYARDSELPVSTPDPHTHDLFHPRTLKYLKLYLTKQDALENSPRSFGIKWTIVSPRLNPITLPYLIAQNVEAGSPAARIGFEPGHVLVAIHPNSQHWPLKPSTPPRRPRAA